MKKLYIMAAVALALPATVCASYPDGYYNSLNNKTGVALKKAAKAIVRDHTVVSYGDNTWDAFKTTDVMTVDGREAWWDMYSDNVVYVSSGHSGLNIEHSVANSWWGKTKNDAYKDLFHLNPSDATANNRKSNYPLGEIATVTWNNGVTFVGNPKPGQGGGATYVFEPKDCYKGDFARAFMYIFTVYDDINWVSSWDWMYDYPMTDLGFKPWARELLLRWNDADPVDAKESARNEAIYAIQHNRNPYIDLEDMCHYIWGDKSGQPYSVGGVTPGPGPEPGPTEINMTWDFDKSSNISDYEADGWSRRAVSGNLSGWYIKSYDGNNYATCSAYLGLGNGGPYENWLVTPALKVGSTANPRLSFRTQGAYGCDDSTLEVYALDGPNPALASRTRLDADICTPPADGSRPVYSDWVPSGDISLAGLGETVYVGFRYYSAQGGPGHSATYCVDDVKVWSDPAAGIEEPEAADGADMLVAYCADGALHLLAPAELTVSVVDLAGRVVATLDLRGEAVVELPSGIYLVAAPGCRTLKVAVR